MKKLLVNLLVSLTFSNFNISSIFGEESELRKKQLELIEKDISQIEDGLQDEFYGTSKDDFIIYITLGNDFGNVVNLKLDTYRDIYELDYEREGETIKYHYHNRADLEADLKLHQEHINNDFEEWEKINWVQEVRENIYLDDNPTRLFDDRLNRIERVNQLEANGFLGLSKKEIKDLEKLREENKQKLKIENGYDYDKRIDYVRVLGKDWKCKIHTEEGKKLLEITIDKVGSEL